MVPSLEEVCLRSLHDQLDSNKITLKTLENNLNWVMYEKLID